MSNFRGSPPRSPRLRVTPSVAFFGEDSWTPNTVRSGRISSVEDFRLTPDLHPRRGRVMAEFNDAIADSLLHSEAWI